jgi:hypothetical protein
MHGTFPWAHHRCWPCKPYRSARPPQQTRSPEEKDRKKKAAADIKKAARRAEKTTAQRSDRKKAAKNAALAAFNKSVKKAAAAAAVSTTATDPLKAGECYATEPQKNFLNYCGVRPAMANKKFASKDERKVFTDAAADYRNKFAQKHGQGAPIPGDPCALSAAQAPCIISFAPDRLTHHAPSC